VNALLGLDPDSYTPHALHNVERGFPETNCYTDLWIELVHAYSLEPLAMLAYATCVDFEGDQWTFFKPPPADLERLYGMEVFEFMVYRSLPEHIEEQISLGRPVIVEVDSYYLPDTAGRSYELQHEKSSVAVEAIDSDGRRLRYFHGPGFFELSGDDFDNALRIGREFSVDVLPPYIEFVRLDRLAACPAGELRHVAHDLLATQLERRPATNPVLRFGARLAEELPRLAGDAAGYHLYAFATVRQCGAAWEAAASFLTWLDDGAETSLSESASQFGTLATESKTLLFKLARAAATGRPLDTEPAIESLASIWDDAIELLTTSPVSPSVS
jgi:Domain of unknown function (DUF1839)